MEVKTLDEYLARYGRLLAQQAEAAMRPLHIPGRDPLRVAPLLREPFDAQAHVITAGAKAMRKHKGFLVIGEMGVGKTLIGQAICHTHGTEAKGGYRALVFCPPQLVKKWEREIRETIPDVAVVQLSSWKVVFGLYEQHARLVPDGDKGRLVRSYTPATRPTWYILARETAKLGAKWRPAYVVGKEMLDKRNRRPGRRWQDEKCLRCPDCRAVLTKPGKTEADAEEQAGYLYTPEDLARRQRRCEACKAPLYQYTRELWKWAPARFIHKKLKGFFDYVVADEAHEEKASDTAQANALGSCIAASRRTIALTGTLIGGYAEHVRPLLFRLAPTSLVREGFGWKDSMPFNEKYGRIETRVTEREGGGKGDSNRQSKGSTGKTTAKYVRPGIMPTLFGRHLMSKAVFLGLDEVAAHLPRLEEVVQGVPMDPELAAAYEVCERQLGDAVRQMVAMGDKRLLGPMLNCLLCYPDYPFGWDRVGYYGGQGFVPVTHPRHLDPEVVRNKEQSLLDLVDKEVGDCRQVWVYTVMTGERDVADRLAGLIRGRGHRVKVLRATVPPKEREDWIAANGPKADVIISHPKLVETGLDLFDKRGGHNFSSLIWYSTGYGLFTLRQASRRSWRIGQRLPCRVHYLFYEATMQSRAMALMGKKLAAAHALEGKFSSEGLVAMSGEEGIEMALAKSLAERIDEGSPSRAWVRIGSRDAVAGVDMDDGDFLAAMERMKGENAWLFEEFASIPAAEFQEAAPS